MLAVKVNVSLGLLNKFQVGWFQVQIAKFNDGGWPNRKALCDKTNILAFQLLEFLSQLRAIRITNCNLIIFMILRIDKILNPSPEQTAQHLFIA